MKTTEAPESSPATTAMLSENYLSRSRTLSKLVKNTKIMDKAIAEDWDLEKLLKAGDGLLDVYVGCKFQIQFQLIGSTNTMLCNKELDKTMWDNVSRIFDDSKKRHASYRQLHPKLKTTVTSVDFINGSITDGTLFGDPLQPAFEWTENDNKFTAYNLPNELKNQSKNQGPWKTVTKDGEVVDGESKKWDNDGTKSFDELEDYQKWTVVKWYNRLFELKAKNEKRDNKNATSNKSYDEEKKKKVTDIIDLTKEATELTNIMGFAEAEEEKNKENQFQQPIAANSGVVLEDDAVDASKASAAAAAAAAASQPKNSPPSSPSNNKKRPASSETEESEDKRAGKETATTLEDDAVDASKASAAAAAAASQPKNSPPSSPSNKKPPASSETEESENKRAGKATATTITNPPPPSRSDGAMDPPATTSMAVPAPPATDPPLLEKLVGGQLATIIKNLETLNETLPKLVAAINSSKDADARSESTLNETLLKLVAAINSSKDADARSESTADEAKEMAASAMQSAKK